MAKQASRTTNTLFNFTTSIGGQLVTILMQFVTRTVFIQTLGKSYLGISGLFSNILTMLSLAEFGVGSAILFKLYEPIAKEDHHRIAVLMKFYKTVYGEIYGVARCAPHNRGDRTQTELQSPHSSLPLTELRIPDCAG